MVLGAMLICATPFVSSASDNAKTEKVVVNDNLTPYVILSYSYELDATRHFDFLFTEANTAYVERTELKVEKLIIQYVLAHNNLILNKGTPKTKIDLSLPWLHRMKNSKAKPPCK